MRTRFHQGLDDLKDKLLRMGGLAEQALQRAIEAYRRRDPALCRAVFTGEDEINSAEREIDEIAVDLLAMQQPMAVDLRFLVAVLKINADLERVGDQAVNIAQRVQTLISLPECDLPADIPRMASLAAEMVRKALQSFIDKRDDLAQSVLEMDNQVDNMNRDIHRVLSRLMQESPQISRQALDVLLMGRNLERIADHATNIAEDVIFWVRGADVRHQFGAPIKSQTLNP